MNLFSYIIYSIISLAIFFPSLSLLFIIYLQLKALAALSMLLQQKSTKDIVLIVPQWVWIFHVFIIIVVLWYCINFSLYSLCLTIYWEYETIMLVELGWEKGWKRYDEYKMADIFLIEYATFLIEYYKCACLKLWRHLFWYNSLFKLFLCRHLNIKSCCWTTTGRFGGPLMIPWPLLLPLLG